MAVLPKDWPENIRHRKHDGCIRNIGQGAPLFSLPLNRRSMPTTWTGSRLAGVGNDLFFSFRGKDFRAQSEGPAFGRLIEVLADCSPGLGAIPMASRGNQDLLYWVFVTHASSMSFPDSRGWKNNPSPTPLAGCGKTRFEADAVPQKSLVSTAQPDKKKVCVDKTSSSWMCSAT